MGQSGNQGSGAGLDVDEVFSTFLYTTDGTSSKTITNNIDLSGEGGLVWLKRRSGSYSHSLFDTVRGVQKQLQSDATTAESTETGGLSTFTSTGFTIGNVQNQSALGDMVSWTFRKAPKFFDVVTYTGNGTAGRTVSHSLGSAVGMIIVKCTSETQHWAVYHRSQGATKYGLLSNTDAFSAYAGTWNNTEPTSTEITLGTDSWVNGNGKSYVAYLFAHNNNDGGFGPDADQDIIKCGSYTGNGSDTGPEINLGFEPQWVMIKGTGYGDATGGDYRHWYIYDMMRGNPVQDSSSYGGKTIKANESSNESGTNYNPQPTPTGFKLGANRSATNYNGETYIYMAIRRGPLAAPDDATKVFNVNGYSNNSNSNIYNAGFNVDMNINTKRSSYTNYIIARLTGGQTLQTNVNNAAIDYSSGGIKWFDNKSNHIDLSTNWFTTHNDVVSYSWRRAPSYFDVCCYSGTGSARTVSHNLGAVPEMMWIKKRNSTQNWAVYHKGTNGGTDPEDYGLELNSDSAEFNTNLYFNDTAPTSTVFTVGTQGAVNASGDTYIAYLFATVAGVSKVGSYDGNGSNQNIDCGFSSGARFILIKSRQSGGWYVFDTVRGIVAGNDSHLRLDTDAAEAYADSIDTYSGGFNVVQNSTTDLNKGPSDESYIFYAIA